MAGAPPSLKRAKPDVISPDSWSDGTLMKPYEVTWKNKILDKLYDAPQQLLCSDENDAQEKCKMLATELGFPVETLMNFVREHESNAREIALKTAEAIHAVLNQKEKGGDMRDKALKALKTWPKHRTIWQAQVTALAVSGRANEALVFIAKYQSLLERVSEHHQKDMGDLCIDGLCKFCMEHVSSGKLCAGVYVTMDVEHGGFKVMTRSRIAANTVISDEVAFVSWLGITTVQGDDSQLKRWLDNARAEDIARTKEMHPRTYDEIPRGEGQVASLAALEGRIRRLKPEASNDQVQNWMLALARVKLNAHDDGLHHFGVLYNHSCAPNCKIVGSQGKFVAIRDIEAGEELCISYLGSDLGVSFEESLKRGGNMHLGYPVLVRQAFIRIGWGTTCHCPRCTKDMRFLEGLSDEDREAQYGEKAMIAFQEAVEDLPRSFVDMFKDIDKNEAPALENWKDVAWKRAWLYVLQLFYAIHLIDSLYHKNDGIYDHQELCGVFEKERLLNNVIWLTEYYREIVGDHSENMDAIFCRVLRVIHIYLGSCQLSKGVNFKVDDGVETLEQLKELHDKYEGFTKNGYEMEPMSPGCSVM